VPHFSLFWEIVWYTWATIWFIIGLVKAIGRIDDWKDPDHVPFTSYKKTYYND
jgi:hypothetical protein